MDGTGRAYVTGLTLSTNFPVVNASQAVHGGGFSDVFVTALNESGSAFVYSTYLGGSAMENEPGQSLGPSIAVTPSGEASVTGTTQSTNFPVTADAWHRTHAGGVNDVFVSKFDAAGMLQYSTLLGGPGADYSRDIAVDSIGNSYVAGTIGSADFSILGTEDAFVTKLSPHGSRLYSTFLGGGGADEYLALVDDCVWVFNFDLAGVAYKPFSTIKFAGS